jgi:hypothetical protein
MLTEDAMNREKNWSLKERQKVSNSGEKGRHFSILKETSEEEKDIGLVDMVSRLIVEEFYPYDIAQFGTHTQYYRSVNLTLEMIKAFARINALYDMAMIRYTSLLGEEAPAVPTRCKSALACSPLLTLEQRKQMVTRTPIELEEGVKVDKTLLEMLPGYTPTPIGKVIQFKSDRPAQQAKGSIASHLFKVEGTVLPDNWREMSPEELEDEFAFQLIVNSMKANKDVYVPDDFDEWPRERALAYIEEQRAIFQKKKAE